MNTVPVSIRRRREFLSTASLWIAGCTFLDLFPDRRPSLQTTTALPEELTAADLEAIKKSVMAGELDQYFGKGYSCAESLLIVGLRHLQLSEDLVWAAAGFGGGMLHREACGFLTSGIMDVGLAAGQLKLDRKEAKEWNKQRVDSYWTWWTAQAPLRCADIRKEGTSSKVCRRLGLLAAVEVENLITSFPAPAEKP